MVIVISSLLILLLPFHLGLAVMGTYEVELAKTESGRQELANAEKLFDLSFTMYPELLQVQRDMKGLRLVYDIYKAQKVSMCVSICAGVCVSVSQIFNWIHALHTFVEKLDSMKQNNTNLIIIIQNKLSNNKVYYINIPYQCFR